MVNIRREPPPQSSDLHLHDRHAYGLLQSKKQPAADIPIAPWLPSAPGGLFLPPLFFPFPFFPPPQFPGGGGSAIPALQYAYRSTLFANAVGSLGFTALALDVETYNRGGFTAVSLDEVILLPVAGLWWVHAMGRFDDAGNTTGYRYLKIRPNGSDSSDDPQARVPPAGGGSGTIIHVDAVLEMARGAPIEVMVTQTSGGPQDIDGEVTLVLLGS